MPDLQFFTGTELSLIAIAQITFLFVLGAYVMFTAIFYYHWHAYGLDTRVTNYTLIIYFATTLPLLLVMAILLLTL